MCLPGFIVTSHGKCHKFEFLAQDREKQQKPRIVSTANRQKKIPNCVSKPTASSLLRKTNDGENSVGKVIESTKQKSIQNFPNDETILVNTEKASPTILAVF